MLNDSLLIVPVNMVFDAFVVKVRVLFMTALIYCQRNFKKEQTKTL